MSDYNVNIITIKQVRVHCFSICDRKGVDFFRDEYPGLRKWRALIEVNCSCAMAHIVILFDCHDVLVDRSKQVPK